MTSHRARTESHSLQISVADLPDTAVWRSTVQRLHRLTLMTLGADLANVRVELRGGPAGPAATAAAEIECRVTVKFRRVARVFQIETRHTDGALAVMHAFTRAQREAQRLSYIQMRQAQGKFPQAGSA